MDNTITLYLIKASVSLALFYGLYMLFLKGDTFFKVRRAYFLFAMLFSLLFPVLVLEIPVQQMETESPVYMSWFLEMEASEIEVTPAVEPNFNLWHLLGLIAVAVSVILVFRLAIQMFSVAKLRVNNNSYKVSSFRIIELPNREMSPFSFFNWIFINTDTHSREKLEEIIAHEQVHVRQLHSIDVIFSELLCVCFWWNPFAWLLRNEMRLNLEYLADQGVLRAGFNSKEYQYILLQTTNKNTGIPIINNFNVSQLKKRITMINKKNTSMYKVAKYLLALPLGLVLMLGNSVQASSDMTGIISEGSMDHFITNNMEYPVEARNSGTDEKANLEYGTSATVLENTDKSFQDGKPIDFAEVMPRFPGDGDAMEKFIVDNLKYPVVAQESRIQGRVTLRFVVSKTGKIKDVTVVRGIDPACDREAVRIIKTMPDWIPGRQDGKAVDVYFTLPITFRLNNEDKEVDKKIITLLKEGKVGNGASNPIDVMPKFPGVKKLCANL